MPRTGSVQFGRESHDFRPRVFSEGPECAAPAMSVAAAGYLQAEAGGTQAEAHDETRIGRLSVSR